MTEPTEPTLFPIGHYGGRYFPGAGEPLAYHQVRVGRRDVLLNDAEFAVWQGSHGSSSRPDVLAGAAAAGSEATIDTLLGNGVLVEVPPGGGEDFSRDHRVVPLLVGLGNTREDLAGYRIGVAGFDPLLTADRVGAELWQFAADCESLWAACELLAAVARDAGEGDPTYTDPALLLDAALPAVRTLLRHHAAHLDITAARAAE